MLAYLSLDQIYDLKGQNQETFDPGFLKGKQCPWVA
jgi:hypothetical protein